MPQGVRKTGVSKDDPEPTGQRERLLRLLRGRCAAPPGMRWLGVIFYEPFSCPGAKLWSRLAHGKSQQSQSIFLKNNSERPPTWQEIVDFS
jgi:hypothetical protein